jgi:hypothetical protein
MANPTIVRLQRTHNNVYKHNPFMRNETFCALNAELLNFETGGTYSYHCVLCLCSTIRLLSVLRFPVVSLRLMATHTIRCRSRILHISRFYTVSIVAEGPFKALPSLSLGFHVPLPFSSQYRLYTTR